MTESPGTRRQRVSWSERLLSRLTRVTTSGKFISEIDGLRFIAIGTVILFHVVVNLSFKAPVTYAVPTDGNWLVAIARHGFRGVELFFIISGFILATPFASHHLLGKSKINLRQYFLRRVTRLEPPYMLCMIFFFFAAIVIKGGSASELFPHLAASLGYLHNIIYKAESAINNVAWSLEIEIQFYILVPVLSAIFMIRKKTVRRSIIIAACVLSAVHQSLFIGPEDLLYLTIVRFIHFFLLGFLLADVYLVDWKEKPSKRWRWDVVSLIGWPLLFTIWNHPDWSEAILKDTHEPILASVLFPILAFSLYLAVFRGKITNRIMTNPWITTIGGMCYTIYLFHNQLIGLIAGVTKDLVPTSSYTINILIQSVLIVPVMLAAASLFFMAVERPCMYKDWPKRFIGKVNRILVRDSTQAPGTDVQPAVNNVHKS